MSQNQNRKVLLLLTVACFSIAALLFVPAIPQDPDYHQFVDNRTLLGIHNFWNVISNAGFLIAGVFGLMRVAQLKDSPLRQGYVVFCFSVLLIGLGSSYYHFTPTTATLLWDRLPMAVAFMALLATVITDAISPRAGRLLLMPLILIGIASVGYWYLSETRGAGDLRFYGLVQALPMVFIPLILALFGLKQLRANFLWLTFIAYLLAKIAEYMDEKIYVFTAVVSGHSLKHVLASLAILWAILTFTPPARDER